MKKACKIPGIVSLLSWANACIAKSIEKWLSNNKTFWKRYDTLRRRAQIHAVGSEQSLTVSTVCNGVTKSPELSKSTWFLVLKIRTRTLSFVFKGTWEDKTALWVLWALQDTLHGETNSKCKTHSRSTRESLCREAFHEISNISYITNIWFIRPKLQGHRLRLSKFLNTNEWRQGNLRKFCEMACCQMTGIISFCQPKLPSTVNVLYFPIKKTYQSQAFRRNRHDPLCRLEISFLCITFSIEPFFHLMRIIRSSKKCKPGRWLLELNGRSAIELSRKSLNCFCLECSAMHTHWVTLYTLWNGHYCCRL